MKEDRYNESVRRMFDVADDGEAAILDDLRRRAGLTWECRDEDGRSHWTNDEFSVKCESCGKAKSRVTTTKQPARKRA